MSLARELRDKAQYNEENPEGEIFLVTHTLSKQVAKLEEEISEVKKEVLAEKKRRGDLFIRNQVLETEKKPLVEKLKKAEAAAKAAKGNLKGNKASMLSMSQKQSQMETEIKALRQEISGLNKDLKKFPEMKEELEAAKLEAKKNNQLHLTAKGRADTLQIERDKLKEGNEKLEKTVNILRTGMSTLEADRKRLEKELEVARAMTP